MKLDIQWAPDMGNASFVLADCNYNAYRWLQNTDLWPNNHAILVGPRFSGKTHLATIWAKSNRANWVTSDEDSVLLEANKPYVIDMLDNMYDEIALMNIFYQATTKVLWLATDQYNFDAIQLVDLQSRFASLIKIKITEPDEDAFKKILQKRCRDFGLSMSNESMEYLVRRAPITYRLIEDFMRALDLECLNQQRPPSITIIHDILEREF